jgi:hypothetical protein
MQPSRHLTSVCSIVTCDLKSEVLHDAAFTPFNNCVLYCDLRPKIRSLMQPSHHLTIVCSIVTYDLKSEILCSLHTI